MLPAAVLAGAIAMSSVTPAVAASSVEQQAAQLAKSDAQQYCSVLVRFFGRQMYQPCFNYQYPRSLRSFTVLLSLLQRSPDSASAIAGALKGGTGVSPQAFIQAQRDMNCAFLKNAGMSCCHVVAGNT